MYICSISQDKMEEGTKQQMYCTDEIRRIAVYYDITECTIIFIKLLKFRDVRVCSSH